VQALDAIPELLEEVGRGATQRAIGATLRPLAITGERRTMKRWFLIGIAALVSALAAAGSQAGVLVNDTHVTETVPVTNPCNGEAIVFTVTFHQLLALTADSAGGVHRVVEVNGETVFGTGTSGTAYVGKDVVASVRSDNGPNAEFERTIIENFHVISLGGGENFYETFRFKLTIDANNNVAVTFLSDNPVCRG
jgi:hypothetical protein